MADMNELELTGRSRTHIEQLEEPRVALHRDVVQPFLALRAKAAEQGIDLTPFSAFRDFGAQAEIWNKKFRGERPLYDRDGNVRDHASLSPPQIVDAILVWSAVPAPAGITGVPTSTSTALPCRKDIACSCCPRS